MHKRACSFDFSGFVLLCLVAVFVSTSCTTAKRRPDKVSDSAVVLSVPVASQDERYECGNVSLEMLLGYYAHVPDLERVADLKEKAAEKHGLSGGEMLDFLKAEGFDTALFPGSLSHEVDGLYYHLDKGRPLLVAMSRNESDHHFVLATGYDPEYELVFLQDPIRGGISIAAWEFEVQWKKAKNFCLVAVPQAQ